MDVKVNKTYLVSEDLQDLNDDFEGKNVSLKNEILYLSRKNLKNLQMIIYPNLGGNCFPWENIYPVIRRGLNQENTN